MSGVNKVILLGNVGTAPDIKHLDNGRSVAKLTLATSRVYKNHEGERVEITDWHKLVFWSPLSSVVEKYVTKGAKLYIEGRITTRSYTNKNDERRYLTEIEVREMQMIDKPKSQPPSEASKEDNPYHKSSANNPQAQGVTDDEIYKHLQ